MFMPAVKAADPVYFSAINDRVLPLKAETMPEFVGDTLYLPYTFFSSSELGVYFTSSSNMIMLYSSEKWLKFDVARATVFDQAGQQYYFPARTINGSAYLPAQKVCDFFGLTLYIIDSEPAPIVRVKSSSAILNDRTFPYYSRNKADMWAYYKEYTGIGTPAASPSGPAAASPSPSAPSDQTYERVTIYLSFHKCTGKMLGKLLDAFDASGYRCSIFVAADEVADNADLLRRAAGEGHTIGIWLKNGTFDDYRTAAQLLFEATKIRTLLVASPSNTAAAAEATAEANGLIYWNATRRYENTPTLTAVTSKLTVIDGSRESLCFAGTDTSMQVIKALLQYLRDKQYSVRKITETSTRIPSIS